MNKTIISVATLLLVLVCGAWTMTESEFRAMGCIACAQKPDCRCESGYSCSIQDRTCETCYKVICQPMQPSQSQSVAGELFSTLPPLPPPIAPAPATAPIPTSTVVASSTCITQSTLVAFSTSINTLRIPVYATVISSTPTTLVQTQFTTSYVPVQVAGTVMFTIAIPTVSSSYCISSLQMITSNVQVSGQSTLLNTFQSTQLAPQFVSSTMGQVQFVPQTFTNLTTATVFPIQPEGSLLSVQQSSTCITSTFSTCTTVNKSWGYYPRKQGYKY